MNKKMLFRILCLLIIGLLLSNIFTDFKLADAPYLQIILQAGIVLILLDFIIKPKVQENSTLKDGPQNTQRFNYNFILSKIGLSTILASTLIQSLMF